jgi:phosphodiesterase/alkaline phosphatase D-like protein
MRASPGTRRILAYTARLSGAVALTVFALVVAREGLPWSLDEESWEKQVQAAGFLLAAAGYLIALRRPGVGGAVLGSAAGALAILGSRAVDPGEAWLGALSFAVPALLFLASWLPVASRRSAVSLFLVTTICFAGGAYGVTKLHAHLFGPTHPQSPLEAEPAGIVEWAWAGAVTHDAVTVNARLAFDSDRVRLVVASDSDLAEPVASSPVAVADEDENHRVVSLTVNGLQPATRYYWAVEAGDRLDRTRTGTFRTFPVEPASFSFAVGADARTGSNGLVFDAIRSHDPLVFLHLGDFHYANVDSNDTERFERAYDSSLASPAQSALYRSTATAYLWDDHDYGPDNSDRNSPSREAAVEIYRRYVPHYELPGDASGAIYQAFTIGRVRFILTDTRSMRDPPGATADPSHTMLGIAQKEWLKDELLAASGRYPLIVWANPAPWIGEPTDRADDWGGFDAERREIAGFIAAHNIRGLLMVSADAHMLAIDDGTNSDYSASRGAAFPVLVAAALDRKGRVVGGPYSEGMFPGSGQFGLVEVIDDGGPEITVTVTGRNYRDEVVVSHTFLTTAPR